MRYFALSDKELLGLSKRGDQQAFSRLYLRYSRRLKAFLFNRCGQREALVEDLLQQVFLQMLESSAYAKPQQGPEILGPYLFAIAKHVLANDHRAQNRRTAHENHLDRNFSVSPDEAPETPGSSLALEQGLALLSDEHREVVQLKFTDGLTINEIAELLACSPGTVKSRLHYGLKKLGKLMNSKIKQS